MAADRYYQKDNPEIEPLAGVVTKSDVATNGGSVSMPNSRYTKPEAFKTPQALFVIYSGGTEREKDYFHLILRNPDLFPFVRIAFHAEPNFDEGGKPSIINFATEQTKEYQESASKENTDSYFLLTDVDHFENFMSEMQRDCDASNITLIISNSCFEVWLYYAEKSDRCDGFEIPQNKLEISSAFKTWANTQIKGGLKPTKAIFNIERNIANAKNNYVEENSFPTLFSTQMFRLAEQMLPFVNDGLVQLRSEIERRRLNTRTLPNKSI
ncbi:MAG: RloB domain-containing protein [Bacteroidaceae bacterium]|nr:RloB domain-containing protein [Bacteroidaceae bacterium]